MIEFTGLVCVNPSLGKQSGRLNSIVCEAGAGKKADSAAKRARQAEKRRLYNKARKSEIRTRMKKVKFTPFITILIPISDLCQHYI